MSSKKTPTKKTEISSAQPKAFTFHYIKATDFRTAHVDGVFGGGTPQGLIHMTFFAERPAIPREIVFEITPEGQLGIELSRHGLQGITRELQVDLMMSLDTAKSIRTWLGEHIAKVEETLGKGK